MRFAQYLGLAGQLRGNVRWASRSYSQEERGYGIQMRQKNKLVGARRELRHKAASAEDIDWRQITSAETSQQG